MRIARAAAAVGIPSRGESIRRFLPSRLKYTSLWRAAISLVVVAAAWEVLGRLVFTNTLVFVPLSSVGEALVKQLSDGTLQPHLVTSLKELTLGFALAAVLGLGAGWILAVNDTALEYSEVWISALYATPMVALAPIIVLWLGIGIWSKVTVVVLVATFPILINTISGIRSTDTLHIEVARSFGADRWQMYTKVLLPSAVPPIVAGLRLAVGRAIVGVVIAELFGARSGLGFLILTSAQVFDTATLFLSVLILASFGVASMSFLKWVEHRLAPWRHFALEQ